MASKVLYLIGSLRNPRIAELGNMLRANNPDVEVFNDWLAAGPEADDHWKSYEQNRNRSYHEALHGEAAKNVFAFDKRHLDRSTHALLVLPAGKSGHMEVMYAAYGVGAKTAILLDPEDVRWDVMYQFIPTVLNNDGEIEEWLNQPSQVSSTTEINPVSNLSRGQPSKVWRQSLDLGLRNTPPTTGGEVFNIAGWSEPPSVTSTPSMTAKTKTLKAR
jgi:hypothetical protein